MEAQDPASTDVNERLVNSSYPIHQIDEILNSRRNSKGFCLLDLFKAYLYVPVDVDNINIQIITTRRGVYRMHRLSFNIKIALSKVNRILDQIL